MLVRLGLVTEVSLDWSNFFSTEWSNLHVAYRVW